MYQSQFKIIIIVYINTQIAGAQVCFTTIAYMQQEDSNEEQQAPSSTLNEDAQTIQHEDHTLVEGEETHLKTQTSQNLDQNITLNNKPLSNQETDKSEMHEVGNNEPKQEEERKDDIPDSIVVIQAEVHQLTVPSSDIINSPVHQAMNEEEEEKKHSPQPENLHKQIKRAQQAEEDRSESASSTSQEDVDVDRIDQKHKSASSIQSDSSKKQFDSQNSSSSDDEFDKNNKSSQESIVQQLKKDATSQQNLQSPELSQAAAGLQAKSSPNMMVLEQVSSSINQNIAPKLEDSALKVVASNTKMEDSSLVLQASSHISQNNEELEDDDEIIYEEEGGQSLSSFVVEISPKGRFKRFGEELGRGAYKIVYNGVDNETGREIAWNVINLNRLPGKERQRIKSEIELIKKLEHKNIIHFITAWYNKEKEQVAFITEMITGGSLRKYVKRIKTPRLKVIKGWCKEILNGLVYLHEQKPHPIIHRDIKCDNIFINSNSGEIRIGDLGLSTPMQNSYTTSVLGTPEFMAPELYEECYGTGVDIYAFGMCVLEMITLERPYKECNNPAQIYNKVIHGIRPQALDRIQDEEVKQFILQCLLPQEQRPSAQFLLNSKFLNDTESEKNNHEVPLQKAYIKKTVNTTIAAQQQPRKVMESTIIEQEEEDENSSLEEEEEKKSVSDGGTTTTGVLEKAVNSSKPGTAVFTMADGGVQALQQIKQNPDSQEGGSNTQSAVFGGGEEQMIASAVKNESEEGENHSNSQPKERMNDEILVEASITSDVINQELKGENSGAATKLGSQHYQIQQQQMIPLTSAAIVIEQVVDHNANILETCIIDQHQSNRNQNLAMIDEHYLLHANKTSKKEQWLNDSVNFLLLKDEEKELKMRIDRTLVLSASRRQSFCIDDAAAQGGNTSAGCVVGTNANLDDVDSIGNIKVRSGAIYDHNAILDSPVFDVSNRYRGLPAVQLIEDQSDNVTVPTENILDELRREDQMLLEEEQKRQQQPGSNEKTKSNAHQDRSDFSKNEEWSQQQTQSNTASVVHKASTMPNNIGRQYESSDGYQEKGEKKSFDIKKHFKEDLYIPLSNTGVSSVKSDQTLCTSMGGLTLSRTQSNIVTNTQKVSNKQQVGDGISNSSKKPQAPTHVNVEVKKTNLNSGFTQSTSLTQEFSLPDLQKQSQSTLMHSKTLNQQNAFLDKKGGQNSHQNQSSDGPQSLQTRTKEELKQHKNHDAHLGFNDQHSQGSFDNQTSSQEEVQGFDETKPDLLTPTLPQERSDNEEHVRKFEPSPESDQDVQLPRVQGQDEHGLQYNKNSVFDLHTPNSLVAPFSQAKNLASNQDQPVKKSSTLQPAATNTNALRTNTGDFSKQQQEAASNAKLQGSPLTNSRSSNLQQVASGQQQQQARSSTASQGANQGMVNIVRSNLLDSKPLANTQSAQSPQVQQRPSIQQHAQPLLDPHKPQIAPSSAQLPQATQGKTPTKPKEQDTPQTQLQTSTSHSGTMNKPQLPPKVPTVAGPQKVSMEIKVKKGQDVSFDFDIVSDTPLNVAKEMVRELELNESYIAEIQKQIVQQIAKNGISPLPASLIQDSSLLNQLDKQQQHGIQPIVQTTHTPIQTNISGVQVQQQQQQSKSSVVGLSPSHHPTIPFFTSPPHITTPANTPMQQQPQPPHLSQHHSVLQTQQSTSQPHPTPATVQQLTFPTPNPQSGVLPTPNSTKTVLSIGKGDLSNAFHLYASFDGQPPRILLENCYISRTPQKGQAMQPYLILNHDIKYLHKYLDPEDQEFELLGGADISNAVAIGIQKDVFLQLTDQTGLSAKKHSAATGSLQPLISNNSTAGNNSLSLPQQKKAATLTKPIQKSDAGDMFQKLLSDIELFYNQMKQLGVENTEEIVDAMECSTEEKGIRFAFLNKVILAKREYKQLREAYKKSLAKQQQKVATSATMTLPTPQQETSTAAQSEQSEYLSAAKAQKQTSTQSQIVPSQQVDQSHKKTSMDNNKPPIIIQEDIKQQKITYTVPSYIRKQFKSSPQTIACSTKLSKHLKRRDPDDLSDIIDEEVRELQQLLNLLWHDSVYLHAKKADTSEKQKQILDSHIPLKVDGIFDEKTEKCVIKFQKFKELTQNGVVTDKIWSLMIQQADSIMAEDIKKQKSVVIQQNEMKPMPSSVHGGGSTKELKFQQITANGGGGNSQQQASNFQNIPQPGLQSASSISSSNKKQQSDQIKPSSTQQQLNASPSRMHRQSQQHIDYSMAIENLSKQQKQGVPQQMHSLPVVFLHPTGSQDSQFAQDINANLGSITSANSVKHVQIGGVPSQNKIYNQQMHVDEDEDC